MGHKGAFIVEGSQHVQWTVYISCKDNFWEPNFCTLNSSRDLNFLISVGTLPHSYQGV